MISQSTRAMLQRLLNHSSAMLKADRLACSEDSLRSGVRMNASRVVCEFASLPGLFIVNCKVAPVCLQNNQLVTRTTFIRIYADRN